MVHEFGDEFLRPTNRPWKCPKCGNTFLTVSVILSHKESCKGPVKNLNEETYAADHRKKLDENLLEFKKVHGLVK